MKLPFYGEAFPHHGSFIFRVALLVSQLVRSSCVLRHGCCLYVKFFCFFVIIALCRPSAYGWHRQPQDDKNWNKTIHRVLARLSPVAVILRTYIHTCITWNGRIGLLLLYSSLYTQYIVMTVQNIVEPLNTRLDDPPPDLLFSVLSIIFHVKT